jgi:hypothetical protein
LLVPAPPAWALPIAALAILAIGLVPGWWRLAGILPILAGLGAGYLAATPSLLVAHNGDLVGFRAPDGELILSRSRGAEIAREIGRRSLYPYSHIKAFTDGMIHIPGGDSISHEVDLVRQIIQFCKQVLSRSSRPCYDHLIGFKEEGVVFTGHHGAVIFYFGNL